MTAIDDLVRGLVHRHGPLSFEQVVELALYAPEGGFYSSGGRAGRRGDFMTSVEVGPLFGTLVARAIDGWWSELGQPPVLTVVEAGAGAGTLARAVLAAAPACRAALRYVLVEASADLRHQQAARLPLEPASWGFTGPEDDDEDDDASAPPPAGPIVVSLAELPRVGGPCIVLANELLDNLPFGLLERTADGWAEVRVGTEDEGLIEVLVPTTGPPVPLDAAPGARIPVQGAAGRWVRDAIGLAGPRGRVVAIDYTSTTQAMAARPSTDWLRTYRDHGRGGAPLEALGSQDITCEVAVDQLPPTARELTQAEWLRSLGIEELVDQGRRVWRERAAVGDLEAVRARSRVGEAEALLDPAGLGGFCVLEWDGA